MTFNYKKIKSEIYDNKYTKRYLVDMSFKTQVILYRSFFVNLLYVGVNAVSGVVYHTYWFWIFAVYYAIMALIKFLLVHYTSKNELGRNVFEELKCARLCAYILLTVNLTLSGVVLMMVYHNRRFEYQGVLIYAMAAYTFYITGASIVELIKYRKYKSPVMSASKIVKLTAALFSMLFLETAMYSQFGGNTSLETQRLMIIATGAGISIIVVIMSVNMIIQTTKGIKNLKESEKQ